LVGTLRRLAAETDEIGVAKLGPYDVVVINSPRYVHEMLLERALDFHKGPTISVYGRPVLGNGLITSEDDFHRQQRKLMAPGFVHRRIAGFADTMAADAESAQQGWADGATIDFAREMMRLTLSIVGKTLFDADVLGEADELGRALTVAMQWTIRQSRSSIPIRIPLHWNTPGNVRVRRAIERIDRTVYRFIQERRDSGQYRDDFLSMLLLAQDEDDGSRMTDLQVRDECMNLFLAGHETTSNAMAWTAYLLCRHPGIYRRVREEADAALGGRLPTAEDAERLPYTLQALKESMRIYPPAYVFGRQAIRDVTLGDFSVPKGQIVLISPYMMHHNPRLFPDPETFNPDRFAPEAEKVLPRYAFMPFGGGPRICIGSHFAMLEAQLILAHLAQRVELTLAPNQPIEPEPLVTLRPRNGLKMIVRRRQGAVP
jgi:cytochrome P450